MPTLVERATDESRVPEAIAPIPLFVIPVVPLSVVPAHGMRPFAALAHRASDIHGVLDSLFPGLDDELHFPARLAVDFRAPERVVQNPREKIVARDAHVGVFAVEVARECRRFVPFVLNHTSLVIGTTSSKMLRISFSVRSGCRLTNSGSINLITSSRDLTRSII
jgi:hypothetical protein